MSSYRRSSPYGPTPHLVTWTRETLRDEGVHTAFAVNEYFGLFVAPAGAVPNGSETPGVPLMLDHAGGNEITLTWGASCRPTDTDYAIYEGAMGSFLSHVPVATPSCSTAGATSATFQPGPGDRYYLVVPQGAEREGSYGTDGNGTPRPPSASACRPQFVGACP